MIELIDVNKSYLTNSGPKHVLQNVNLKIPEETNLGIIGPNGSGKSTLLRLLGGSEFPNSGRIVTNKRISWPLGLAGAFQGSLTGLENIEFVCRIHGLNRREMNEVIDFVYDFAEIGPYFTMPIKTYSTGMRGRVTFGLSLAFKFDVYLVDELTSVGDMDFRRKATAAFESLQDRASIMFASHSLSTLLEFCNAGIIMLGDGHIKYFPSIQEAVDAYEEIVNKQQDQKHPGDKNDKK